MATSLSCPSGRVTVGHLLLGQKVGVQDGWAGRGHLRQGHDVLEGDIRLRAGVHQLRLRRRREHLGPGRPPQHLDHDGLFGRLKGLHGLVMSCSGEVFAVDLLRNREGGAGLRSSSEPQSRAPGPRALGTSSPTGASRPSPGSPHNVWGAGGRRRSPDRALNNKSRSRGVLAYLLEWLLMQFHRLLILPGKEKTRPRLPDFIRQ